ncbi:LYR motif containing protein 1-like [Rhopilema esculentum]|uniref:LYR motif containing protein 1-like n=1 Tax=Rhopilema esculentum TaxID=499914 RepID=UPI0031D4C774|eukprot:gene9546-17293_t
MSAQLVFSLYRRILRTAKIWESSSGQKDDTNTERNYIKNEAQRLFRKNMKISDPEEIYLALKEGETRLELALHYKNPYPRPVNVPPLATAQLAGKKLGKGQQRRRKIAKPIYIKSYEEYDKTS